MGVVMGGARRVKKVNKHERKEGKREREREIKREREREREIKEREREQRKLKVGKCVGGSLVEYFSIQLCRVSIKINVSR